MQKIQKNLFDNQIIDCRKFAHQNCQKIIYSLTYRTSQVYRIKMQLKLNCLIGLVVSILFAHANAAKCKLEKIQCEHCS